MKKLFALIISAGLLVGPAVFAQGNEDIAIGDEGDFGKILRYQQKQLEELNERVAALENGQKETVRKHSPVVPKLAEKITLFGDFRYRHEYINSDAPGGADSRNRHRIRARVGLKARLNESLDLVFQLASGSEDPRSTNQTLGDSPGFLSREVWIDQAFFHYHPLWCEGLNIVGGKFPNPVDTHNASKLIWDSDLRVEGLAFVKNSDFDSFQTALIGGGFWVAEATEPAENLMLWGGQASATVPFNDTGHVKAGASYYLLDQDISALPPFGMGGGNTVAGGTYAEDFGIAEVFAEAQSRIAEDWTGTLFGSYVNNVEADNDRDTAYMVGGELGTVIKGKPVAFRYSWREIEADAVLAAFNDSDFGGGGTDSRGHEFGVSVKPTKRTEVAVTYIKSEVGLDADDPASTKAGDEDDYDRLQIDLKFKF